MSSSLPYKERFKVVQRKLVKEDRLEVMETTNLPVFKEEKMLLSNECIRKSKCLDTRVDKEHSSYYFTSSF